METLYSTNLSPRWGAKQPSPYYLHIFALSHLCSSLTVSYQPLQSPLCIKIHKAYKVEKVPNPALNS